MASFADLSGKVALVTGGARGIGYQIAREMAERGATVVVNDLAPSVAQVASEIVAGGGNSLAVVADVSSSSEVGRLVEEVLGGQGRLDILVNNAGITRDGLILRLSDEEWHQVLATNLTGAFLCTRAVLRSMVRQRWGRIINIASVVGLMGNAGQSNYAAAKAGLIGLTKAVAREVASRGITVNAIAPGFIDTDMTRRLSQERKDEIVKQVPLGRFGSPQDVARAVVFLASDEAAYITGQVLNVDGGMVMA
ncbi:MAG: 3-oxoacyl-ACP reductase FabG [Chloroflexi bacterium]|nr:3-oxoacyl-ACP reductase FabG [Chloroflexota bacterium]